MAINFGPINFGPSSFRGPVPTIIKKSFSESVVFHELFDFDNTYPVNFFYRLPTGIRLEYENLYPVILPVNDMTILEHHLVCCVEFLKGITPEKYKWIVETTDDDTYYKFYEVYHIVQPTIETIINANDLYDMYPEYCI